MKLVNLVSVTALTAVLAACGGGDIEVDARNQSNTDNSVGDNSNNNTSGGGGRTGDNPCASYEQDGETFQGSYDAPNCVYGTDFVGLAKPYTADQELVFGDLSNDGAHIFNDSLMIGQGYGNDADMEAAGITQGGDGSVLRLEAGTILAFRSPDDYFVINRGSQIFAEGTADEPVVVTSTTDIEGTVGPEEVQQWGGMIINGFGVTNKCSYTGSFADDNLETSDCHIEAEGKAGAGQTFFGGDNNEDNSGVLNYFMVKHTGAQVSPGNELNGISFNAVGSGTEVSYLQVYSTYDDGIEFFGGAVDVDHYVGVYVRDDSIDIDEGYRGTINYALVIQSEADGDHCIESDGIGRYSDYEADEITPIVDAQLNSRATINNLTCIVSPSAEGTHAEGHGWRIREAHFPTIRNSILTTAYMPEQGENNYCVRLESAEGLQAAEDGDLVIEESIIACPTLTNGGSLPGGSTVQAFLEANNAVMETDAAGEDPTADETDVNLAILDGFYSLPLGDMVVNGNAAQVTPVDSDFVGGVTANDDWTAGWTYGLHPDNRAQPLWFEAAE
ncbi:serine/threonine protein kinase [Marinimicrobium locisalis]|uniref:serine/threonine protein kinase n=1 Tax=Marinimicrobium locisalis TaxID=546022 RepID=UPI00322157FA